MKGWGLLCGTTLLAASLGLIPAVANAQPELQDATDTEDDATVTLTVRTEGLIDDPLFWCGIEVNVVGAMVPLTAGDTVEVEFIEDDLAFNDIIWTTTHTITQAEANAQAYNEVFDCSAEVMADGIGQLEFFGRATVDKEMCTGVCFNDNPTTSNLDVDGRDDDSFEDDDVAADAANAVDGVPEERIARDEDWVRITLQETGEIDAEFEYMADCGAVDAVLVDENDDMVAEIESGDDGGTVSAMGLSPGVYFLQIQPQDPGDFNFYDLTVDVTFTPDATTGDGDTSGDDSSSDSASDSDSDSDPSASASASDSDASDGSSDSANTGASAGSASSAGSGDTDDDTDDGASQVTDDDGCGCRNGPNPGPTGSLLLLGLVALVRRRS